MQTPDLSGVGDARATSAASAVALIAGGARRAGASAKAVATSLSLHTDLTPRAAEVVLDALRAAAGSGSSGSATAAPVPPAAVQLLGAEWAMGVTTRTSLALSAGHPFVSLQLHLATPDGGIDSRPMHLSLPQLAAFEASLREAAAALERA